MSWLADIQALTFDVGGTLIEPWPSVGHIYAEVAARHGHKDLQPEKLNQQFALAWRNKRNFDHSRRAWLDLVQKTFEGAIPPLGPEFFDDLYNRFARPESWRVFDDVRPALDILRKRGFELGAISNWDERLRPLLDRLQLTPYFRVAVISVEAGVAKPGKEIFQRAAFLLGVAPRRILHVGDSLVEDVLGAQSARFQTLLLSRKASPASAPAITSLADLGPLLESSSPT
jgi:putative hydrolase of the HAD superfamily